MHIDSTMRCFLHSVDRDIDTLEAMKAEESILTLLRGMQDTVRSQWAVILSDEKHNRDVENLDKVQKYQTLNAEVNDIYNRIVDEQELRLQENDLEMGEIDQYILSELFLSYTIFLDAYTELNFYYMICGNFPFDMMLYFADQKSMRLASKSIPPES